MRFLDLLNSYFGTEATTIDEFLEDIEQIDDAYAHSHGELIPSHFVNFLRYADRMLENYHKEW